MNRRAFLGAAGVVAVAFAGCVSGGSDTENGTAPDATAAGAPATTERPSAATADPTAGSDAETPIHPGYETTEIRARSESGERLGTVTAAIADTPDLRSLGLSDTESLPADRGMLFVYESVENRTFVMREMDFAIDIVYADADGTITSIHHAPAPGPDENGNDQRYPGRGQYVLEVVYEWTTKQGVSEGDVLEFSLSDHRVGTPSNSK
ncbi:DUF192 domain-containing protein [Halobellus sp. GM3]|uniref:DUF192 domain-containing protein n=1 Tax=Halobellus sp. GM3 TaxID=3458410 RepID=UPI00403DDFAC